MSDTRLSTAIDNHIACCTSALDEALRTSSNETVRARIYDLQQAKMMHNNPELFFEAQRAMFF